MIVARVVPVTVGAGTPGGFAGWDGCTTVRSAGPAWRDPATSIGPVIRRRTLFTSAGAGALAAAGAGTLSACGTDQYGGGARRRTTNNRQLRVPKAAIPVGGGAIYPDEGYVVTQPQTGTFKAFSNVCPHQGCPVQEITADERIHCLCHNSFFALADGSVLGGPAQVGLAVAEVTDEGTEIIIRMPG